MSRSASTPLGLPMVIAALVSLVSLVACEGTDAGSPIPGTDADGGGSGLDGAVPPPGTDGSADGGGDGGNPSMDGGLATDPLTPGQAACALDSYPGDPLPPAEGDQRRASRIQGGFGFLEGPVWFAEQQMLLFSDMSFSGENFPSVIHRMDGAENITPFLTDLGSNGLAIDPAGQLVACTHDDRTVSRFDIDTKARTPIAERYDGKLFSSPNDVVVHSRGHVYFTDPAWQLGERTRELDNAAYHLRPNGEIRKVTDTLGRPNGIALSTDERTLYIADDQNQRVWQYPVDAQGEVGEGELFLGPDQIGGPDGLAIDCAGNVYVATSRGVQVFAADATSIGTIQVAEQPSNCTFGGADGRTLYITARSGLYKIELNLPGLP